MGKSRVVLLAFLLFVFAVSGVSSQSNEIIDEVLEQDPVSYGEAAYLVLTASGDLQESASPSEAASAPETSAWDFDEKTADSPVSYGEFSYMLMTTFGVQGGLMYRIIPGPRYAVREMSYLGLAPPRTAPGKDISGAAAVGLLTGVLNMQETD